MNRLEQIEEIWSYVCKKISPHTDKQMINNGEILYAFQHIDTVPLFLNDVLVMLTCNRSDIMTYLKNPELLVNKPALLRPDRENNGCLDQCFLYDDNICHCDNGCFKNIQNACQWCNIQSIHRTCRVVSPLKESQHNNKQPGFEDVKKAFEFYNKEQSLLMQEIFNKRKQNTERHIDEGISIPIRKRQNNTEKAQNIIRTPKKAQRIR